MRRVLVAFEARCIWLKGPLLFVLQTTNLLLQAGEEALKTDPTKIGELAPLR